MKLKTWVLSFMLILCFAIPAMGDDICLIEAGIPIIGVSMVNINGQESMAFSQILAPSDSRARMNGPPHISIIKFLKLNTGVDWTDSRIGYNGLAFIVKNIHIKDCKAVPEEPKEIEPPPEVKPRSEPKKEPKYNSGKDTA